MRGSRTILFTITCHKEVEYVIVFHEHDNVLCQNKMLLNIAFSKSQKLNTEFI